MGQATKRFGREARPRLVRLDRRQESRLRLVVLLGVEEPVGEQVIDRGHVGVLGFLGFCLVDEDAELLPAGLFLRIGKEGGHLLGLSVRGVPSPVQRLRGASLLFRLLDRLYDIGLRRRDREGGEFREGLGRLRRGRGRPWGVRGPLRQLLPPAHPSRFLFFGQLVLEDEKPSRLGPDVEEPAVAAPGAGAAERTFDNSPLGGIGQRRDLGVFLADRRELVGHGIDCPGERVRLEGVKSLYALEVVGRKNGHAITRLVGSRLLGAPAASSHQGDPPPVGRGVESVPVGGRVHPKARQKKLLFSDDEPEEGRLGPVGVAHMKEDGTAVDQEGGDVGAHLRAGVRVAGALFRVGRDARAGIVHLGELPGVQVERVKEALDGKCRQPIGEHDREARGRRTGERPRL